MLILVVIGSLLSLSSSSLLLARGLNLLLCRVLVHTLELDLSSHFLETVTVTSVSVPELAVIVLVSVAYMLCCTCPSDCLVGRRKLCGAQCLRLLHSCAILCGGQLVGLFVGFYVVCRMPPLELAQGQCPPLDLVHL